jgi:hypothetical protein
MLMHERKKENACPTCMIGRELNVNNSTRKISFVRYTNLTTQEISDKIAQLITPPDIKTPVQAF